MPLAFETVNRGVIPFGFFNIDTDMLLMDRYFLWGDQFCGLVAGWARETTLADTSLEVYEIEDPSRVGNLHGAISGTFLTGFLGDVYRLLPFPELPEDFKQTEGSENREAVGDVIRRYGAEVTIPVRALEGEDQVEFGSFVFDRAQFGELLYYVWRGGMPMWRENERPAYVLDMMEAVKQSSYWLFNPISAEA